MSKPTDAELRELVANVNIGVGESIENQQSYMKWHDARVTLNSLAMPLAEEVLALRKSNADLRERLKEYREDYAPLRAEESARIREQERDLRDAYHQGRADADEQHFHDQQGGW